MHNPTKGAFIVNCVVNNIEPFGSSKIAAFDLDSTVIKVKSLTKSGTRRKFPQDYDDWELWNDQVKSKLNELVKEGYKIVIFTNQAGKKFDKKQFAQKVRNISSKIGVPMQVYGCTEDGYCRKPSIGMWKILERHNDNHPVDMSSSFYVGDAAGREGDFADSDFKFALNLGLKFYVPDNFFIKGNSNRFSKPLPVHPLSLPVDNNTEVHPKDTQELIILVGAPASGKSTLATKFKKYAIACQDQLKTKKKVLSLIDESLEKGLSVIVDRKNPRIEDRAEFIEFAKKYNVPVRIIWFDLPQELVKHLNKYR